MQNPATENTKAFRLFIHGTVQGVFFRKATLEKAVQYNINGYVRNCDNGTVEVFAEGNESNLKQFALWCHQGPQRAKVTHIDIHESPLKNSQGFVISR